MGCVCSGFVLQYEGGCCCGWDESCAVKVRILGNRYSLEVEAVGSIPIEGEDRVRLAGLLLDAIEEFDSNA